jgi:hypothetical protein
MDNFIDTLRAFATVWGPSVAPMTKKEKRIASLPAGLQAAAIAKVHGTLAFSELISARDHALRQAELKEDRDEQELQKAYGTLFGSPVIRGGRRRR